MQKMNMPTQAQNAGNTFDALARNINAAQDILALAKNADRMALLPQLQAHLPEAFTRGDMSVEMEKRAQHHADHRHQRALILQEKFYTLMVLYNRLGYGTGRTPDRYNIINGEIQHSIFDYMKDVLKHSGQAELSGSKKLRLERAAGTTKTESRKLRIPLERAVLESFFSLLRHDINCFVDQAYMVGVNWARIQPVKEEAAVAQNDAVRLANALTTFVDPNYTSNTVLLTKDQPLSDKEKQHVAAMDAAVKRLVSVEYLLPWIERKLARHYKGHFQPNSIITIDKDRLLETLEMGRNPSLTQVVPNGYFIDIHGDAHPASGPDENLYFRIGKLKGFQPITNRPVYEVVELDVEKTLPKERSYSKKDRRRTVKKITGVKVNGFSSNIYLVSPKPRIDRHRDNSPLPTLEELLARDGSIRGSFIPLKNNSHMAAFRLASKHFPRAASPRDLANELNEKWIQTESKRYLAALRVFREIKECLHILNHLPEDKANTMFTPRQDLTNMLVNVGHLLEESGTFLIRNDLLKVKQMGQDLARIESGVAKQQKLKEKSRRKNPHKELAGHESLLIREFQRLAQCDLDDAEHITAFIGAFSALKTPLLGKERESALTQLDARLQRAAWMETHFGWMQKGSVLHTRGTRFTANS